MGALRKPQHELYAQARAKGLTKPQALERAGYKAKNKTSAAAELENRNADILARVDELLAMGAKAAQDYIESKEEFAERTRDWVLNQLTENVKRAMTQVPVTDKQGFPTGEYKYEGNVANRALELIGKELGMFVERKESGKPGAFKDDGERKLAKDRVIGKLVKLGLVTVRRKDSASVERADTAETAANAGVDTTGSGESPETRSESVRATTGSGVELSTVDTNDEVSESRQSDQGEQHERELPTDVHEASTQAKVEHDPTPLPAGLNPDPKAPNSQQDAGPGLSLLAPSPSHPPVPSPATLDPDEGRQGSGGPQSRLPSSDSGTP